MLVHITILYTYWHTHTYTCCESDCVVTLATQRKDYVVELVSEDVFTYNDQVVKQQAMISEKTTIKEARQSIQCAWNADHRSANAFSELPSWRSGGTLAAMWNRMLGENWMPDEYRMFEDGPEGEYR